MRALQNQVRQQEHQEEEEEEPTGLGKRTMSDAGIGGSAEGKGPAKLMRSDAGT
jgi:hypothetical protein